MVGVCAGGVLVEVAGADVGDGAFWGVAAAFYECYFGVDFEARDAVYDAYAGGFHAVGHVEVVFLVESCFEFDEDCDAFVVFGGGYEGVYDGGVCGDAVLCDFDFGDVGVLCGFVDESYDVVEGLVGVVEHEVASEYVVEH